MKLLAALQAFESIERPTSRKRDACVSVCSSALGNIHCSFSQFAVHYYYCLGYSLLLSLLWFLSPSTTNPTAHHVFVWIILTSFFPSNSKQSHFSLRPPTGEKQTFKASQTMSHTYTHSSIKRHTPAKAHQEAQNGHNGSLIIIHKGDFSVSASKCSSSAAWNDLRS